MCVITTYQQHQESATDRNSEKYINVRIPLRRSDAGRRRKIWNFLKDFKARIVGKRKTLGKIKKTLTLNLTPAAKDFYLVKEKRQEKSAKK